MKYIVGRRIDRIREVPLARMRIARLRPKMCTYMNINGIDLMYYCYKCIIYENYQWQPTPSGFESQIAIRKENPS